MFSRFYIKFIKQTYGGEEIYERILTSGAYEDLVKHEMKQRLDMLYVELL